MSSVQKGHPGDGQLLRYADGELPAGEADRVRSHLEACWQCRAELDELEETISDCVRYRKAVLEAHLPPPPAPWDDIHSRMAEADAAPASSMFVRLSEALGMRATSSQRWATVAVGLVLTFAVVYRVLNAPSARAAELLRRAAAAESTRGAARRIQIRTKKLRVTRWIGAGATVQPATSESAAVESLFHAANYSWEDPLSAKSYLQWRDRLPEKHDEVATTQSSYQIRTTTNSGELVGATLKLRVEDLHAVESTLEFRDHEKVEIEELPGEAPSPATLADTQPEVRFPDRQAPSAEQPKENTEAAAASPADELQVIATLHQLDADLGEPIEVTRTQRQVLVTAVGLDAQRARQIQGALASMPRVVVRFSEPAAPAASAAEPAAGRTPASATAGSNVARLQAKLEAQLGGRAAFEQFSEHALEASEAMMARAHALRRLSQRFPLEIESQLDVQQQRLLHNVRAELAQAFLGQEAGIQYLMSPVLRGLAASGDTKTLPSAAAVSGAAGAWQAATEELFQTAWRVDRLLAVVFAGATTEITGDPLGSQLFARLSDLRAAAEIYKRWGEIER